jgi:hypothetical protein
LLCVGLALWSAAPAGGAVVAAASPSLADVSAAVSSAAEGDTVTIPAGSATWTATMAVRKGITLQGAGAAALDDRTVIVDDVAGGKSNPVFDVELTKNQVFRLTGVAFRHGSRQARMSDNSDGCIRVGGVVRGADGKGSMRIDHCHFDQLYRGAIVLKGWVSYGVIDHNYWSGRAEGNRCSINVDNGQNWGGGKNSFGDGSWAAPTNFGSADFVFIETNAFYNPGKVQTNGGIDCQNGGRYVSRFNTFHNVVMITGHGTETGGRIRGQRAVEFYKNTATSDAGQSMGLTRSGVTLYWGLTWTGKYSGTQIPLVDMRLDWPFRMYDGANGKNPWDVNDTEGDSTSARDGTNVPGHAPHLFESGTHTAADNVPSGPKAVMTDASKTWTANQWAGFEIVNTTQKTKDGNHPNSVIISNTANTVTYSPGSPDGPPKTFKTGEGYVIYKPLIVLDQPSRGQCDLLAGNPPVNTVTGGSAWPHQALEPIYGWLNRVNNVPINVGSRYPTLKENRDYYNQAKAFDGTAGIGVGSLAKRPPTCVKGVAYWATDEGKWDSTHDGPDGRLYVATAPDTWKLRYTPFAYPHPLVGKPEPAPEAK